MPKHAQTERDRILDYLVTFSEINGYMPSLRQIQNGIGFSSLSVVSHHLNILEKNNQIMRSHGVARSIVLIPEAGETNDDS